MFSERLKSLREKNDLTQAQLAKILNTSPQNISYYENGREPSFEVLCRIAKNFRVSTDYLLGLSEFVNFEEEKSFYKINSKIDISSTNIDINEYISEVHFNEFLTSLKTFNAKAYKFLKEFNNERALELIIRVTDILNFLMDRIIDNNPNREMIFSSNLKEKCKIIHQLLNKQNSLGVANNLNSDDWLELFTLYADLEFSQKSMLFLLQDIDTSTSKIKYELQTFVQKIGISEIENYSSAFEHRTKE